MLKLSMTLAALAVPAAVVAAAPMSASQYVMKAGASDLFERDSAQVMKSSSSPAIRQFAEQMIRQHTQSTNDVKAAAMKAGMKPAAPKLDAEQQRMLSSLKSANGTARDQLYVSQQKTAHQQALMVHQDYAANGTVPSLKAAAAKIVPVVQMHIDELAKM